MKTKNVLLIALFLFVILGCKKNKEDETPTPESCSYMSGNFDINFNGNNYYLVVDTLTHFTILYNWYDDEETHFVLIGKDQNGKGLGVEMAVPGIMTKGSHTYSEVISLEINDVGYYTTTVNFEIIESEFDSQGGFYKPLKGTFNGTAKKKNTMGAEPSDETFSYSGSFCLNAGIV